MGQTAAGRPVRKAGRKRCLATLLAAAALGGCGDTDSTFATAIVRDSAGIEIVETAGPAAEQWTMVEEPVLRVGVVEGDEVYQLHRVRGVQRLSDGRIAIANGGTQEVRFYDREGRFLHASGGRGDGPGEFQNLASLHRIRGDSLVAFDSRNGRVTVLDPEGRAASMFGLREATNVEGAVTLEGTTRDGLLLASRIHARDADADGYRRDEAEFMVTARATGDPERLGRFPGRELEYRESSPAPGMITTQQASIPFARSALGVAGADGVFVGSNDTFEVHAFSSDGSLRRIIRRSDAARREVDRGVLEAFVDAALDASPQAGSSPDRAALLGAVLERPRVPSMPTFDRLHVDDAGRLWVREYAEPWESGSPGRWSVFGPQGSLDAVAETHPGLDVYHIGDAYLLGVATNDLGVEEVRMYELQSAPGGSR